MGHRKALSYLQYGLTQKEGFIVITGGVGTTEFAGDERFTIAYGVGYRILFADALSFDIEMRNLIWEMDLLGEEDTTNNLELIFGLNLFF